LIELRFYGLLNTKIGQFRDVLTRQSLNMTHSELAAVSTFCCLIVVPVEGVYVNGSL